MHKTVANLVHDGYGRSNRGRVEGGGGYQNTKMGL